MTCRPNGMLRGPAANSSRALPIIGRVTSTAACDPAKRRTPRLAAHRAACPPSGRA